MSKDLVKQVKSITDAAGSLAEMIAFTKRLTQQEAVENVTSDQGMHTAKQSFADCRCICHPNEHSQECHNLSTVGRECKCKAKAANEVNEPGLNREEMQLISEALERDEGGPIILVPHPPQGGPIVFTPRPITAIPNEVRECKCYMRRMNLPEVIKTPLDTIKEVNSDVAKLPVEEASRFAEKQVITIQHDHGLCHDACLCSCHEPEEILIEPEIPKCEENCLCSCHIEDKQEQQKQEEEEKIPEKPNCSGACELHCNAIPTRGTAVDLAREVVSSVIRAAGETVEKRKKSRGSSILKSDFFKTQKRDSEDSKGGRQSFIKRLSNSFRKSK